MMAVSNGYRTANRPLAMTGLVMVVDDEGLLRRMLRRTMERFGLEVVEAADGVEAIEILNRLGDRVSLVLMDWNMPLLSGEETLSGLRELRPDVPVVVTSGFDSGSLGLQNTGVQIQGFLQKPFRSAGLQTLLKSFLVN
jgi:CheY-like chemotaxis protein